MSDELIIYNEMIKRINDMSDEDLDRLIDDDNCPFQPELIPANVGLGMFHCTVCGEMVVAGCPHPRAKDGLQNNSR